MGLRFIIGRAGTGKTHLCIEEIIHQSNTGAKRQILIVPEQFTSQAERDLIAATGQNAILTAEVLSFGRLAHRVFSKKGIGNRLPLGDIGKAMALRKILLAEKDNISYFHSVLEQPGFYRPAGSDHLRIFSVPHFSGGYRNPRAGRRAFPCRKRKAD